MIKNNKIFGIIHYFDFIVIIIVLVLGFIGSSFFIKNDDFHMNIGNSNRNYSIEFMLSGVREPTYSNISIGDIFYVSETNKIIGEVKSIDIIDHKLLSVNNKSEIMETIHPAKKDLYIVIEGSGSVTGANITMGNKIIKIGNLMEIYNELIETTPVIYGIEEIKN
ncbi:DUF4330 domain-containing protein [Clostridiaceae bacterium HSG29]|nr:DUF4330 domain-containing protein [Clostridiaceae bacterium HSG29]